MTYETQKKSEMISSYPKIFAIVAGAHLLSAFSISADTPTETTVEVGAEVVDAVVAQITGDVKKGKKVFNKCKACHKVKEGKNGAGPSLYDVIGRDAAQIDGFKYSTAMTESGLTWDVATLTEYLKAPKKLVPNTSMSFAGLKKDQDIENVIAYLDDASNPE